MQGDSIWTHQGPRAWLWQTLALVVWVLKSPSQWCDSVQETISVTVWLQDLQLLEELGLALGVRKEGPHTWLFTSTL